MQPLNHCSRAVTSNRSSQTALEQLQFTFQRLFAIVILMQTAYLRKFQVTQPVASGCSGCLGLPNLQKFQSQVSKALNRGCCQQNYNACNCLLTTSALRSLMGYSHTNLKESALQVSKEHLPSIKIQPNAQHATTTKTLCYCYVQMAVTAVLLQPRCY